MKPYVPCTQCESGYRKIPLKETSIGFAFVRCECFLKWQREAVMEERCRRAHLRPSIYEPMPDGLLYHPTKHYLGEKSRVEANKLLQYIDHFRDHFHHQSLYLHGNHSTQKTTLAQWVGRELLERGFRVQYILMKTLIEFLVSRGWEDKEAAFAEQYQYSASDILKADVLIIDEAFDPQKIVIYKSSYQIPFLDQFLREWLDVYEKPILFLSNKKLENIQREIPALKDLFFLLDRKIRLKGGELQFQDVATDVLTQNFEMQDIFASDSTK